MLFYWQPIGWLATNWQPTAGRQECRQHPATRRLPPASHCAWSNRLPCVAPPTAGQECRQQRRAGGCHARSPALVCDPVCGAHRRRLAGLWLRPLQRPAAQEAARGMQQLEAPTAHLACHSLPGLLFDALLLKPAPTCIGCARGVAVVRLGVSCMWHSAASGDTAGHFGRI